MLDMNSKLHVAYRPGGPRASKMIQFNAHFDGRNICPDEPVRLPENVPLRVTVDTAMRLGSTEPAGALDLFDQLEAKVGLIDGPTDWADEHDHYLYGAAKKSDDGTE
jgi:hypothetical protein